MYDVQTDTKSVLVKCVVHAQRESTKARENKKCRYNSLKKIKAKVAVKVKHSCPCTSHEAAQGGVKIRLHSFLMLALNESKWLGEIIRLSIE
jgi:hypothetical protein